MFGTNTLLTHALFNSEREETFSFNLEKDLTVLIRVFIVVMVGVSIAWVPVVTETQGGQVFIYIQEVTNYLAPRWPVSSCWVYSGVDAMNRYRINKVSVI